MTAPTVTSLLKAIQKKCRQCCCGIAQEIIECPIRDCAIWGYRNLSIKEEAPKTTPDLFQRTFEQVVKKS